MLAQHLVDRDAIALAHAERGVASQAPDATDGLVSGHDRERARARDQVHARVLRDVAPAQTDGFDLQHRATVGWLGYRELADLVACRLR